MDFIHGVETRFVDQVGAGFITPDTGVIGIVGIAPLGAKNTIQMITSRRQAVEVFGNDLTGFTLPYALEIIAQQGGARVIAVNVFDPLLHGLAVVDEDVTITAGVAATAFQPYTSVVLTSGDGQTTYVKDTHYTIDAFGNIRVLDGTAIVEGSTILASYSHVNPSAVTDEQVAAGIEVLDTALNVTGYQPKILLCPEFGETDLVAAKLAEKAALYNGVYLLDAGPTATKATVLTGRGPLGGIPGFRTDDKNLYPLFPYVYALDAQGAQVSRPLSPFVAGVIARTDAEQGVQKSPSNERLIGVQGTVVSLTSAGTASDLNDLNRVGVATVYNSRGRGMRLWGNRNASAPVNTAADVFLSVQRVKHMISESIELSMTRYLDRPITQGLIDAIREDGNAYLRGLVGQGALIGGEMTYDPSDNPTADVQQGRLRFNVSFLPPSPAERLTFTLTLDPDYLASLA